jgi:xylitol oxidase
VTTNWAGNISFGARRLHRPATVAELQAIVTAAGRIRALGTGHSFNRLADSPGDQISPLGLAPTMDIVGSTVRVSAAVRYGELSAFLQSHGYALRNLASLPHISVAGAISTGTHGSGTHNGSLSTSVTALEIVTASGDLLRLDRTDPRFPGAVVSLGALGIIVAVTLEIVPAFEVAQQVYEHVPRDEALAALDRAYSVSLFTNWADGDIDQVWVKAISPFEWDRAPADGPRHMLSTMPAANVTEQGGVPGPWHERLPHFRRDFTPSAGDELQSEYFVQRCSLADAMAALDPISSRIAAVVQTSEIRTIAADDLWLSPFYGRDTAAIHFTWVLDTDAVLPVLDLIEEQLAPFDFRPHWGKLYRANPAARYARLPEFAALAAELDPDGKFRNDYLDLLLSAPGGE